MSKRQFQLLYLALCVFAPASAICAPATSEVYSHFGYCAPPFAPPCATKLKNKGATPACEKQVERYVASVFAYRACLSAEMERAVRQANETIRKVRCSKGAAACRDLAPDGGE
jgi:hypothetical protein